MKNLKIEKSIALDLLDLKFILILFLIILLYDIKDDIWIIKNTILNKYKKSHTMIPLTFLFFIIIIGYFVWLYLYNKQKNIFEIKSKYNILTKKDQEVFKNDTKRINSYKNAIIIGLLALSLSLLIMINRLLPVFVFNFVIAFYYGISTI